MSKDAVRDRTSVSRDAKDTSVNNASKDVPDNRAATGTSKTTAPSQAGFMSELSKYLDSLWSGVRTVDKKVDTLEKRVKTLEDWKQSKPEAGTSGVKSSLEKSQANAEVLKKYENPDGSTEILLSVKL